MNGWIKDWVSRSRCWMFVNALSCSSVYCCHTHTPFRVWGCMEVQADQTGENISRFLILTCYIRLFVQLVRESLISLSCCVNTWMKHWRYPDQDLKSACGVIRLGQWTPLNAWTHQNDWCQQYPLIRTNAVAVAVLGPKWAGLEGHRPVQVSQNPPVPFLETSRLPRPAGKNTRRTAAPTEPHEEGRSWGPAGGATTPHILKMIENLDNKSEGTF